MSKYRELKKGDSVRIVGPWINNSIHPEASKDIGKPATVVKFSHNGNLGVYIRLDSSHLQLFWSRKNLRALPRGKRSRVERRHG